MKRCLIVLLTGLLAVHGCTPKESPSGQGKMLNVLCSTFPMYLFTQAVAQGRPEVRIDVMIPPGLGCPHDYALTPQDMRKIASANVFIANGLGMEEFLGEPLRKANGKIIIVDTSAGIGALIMLGHEHEANAAQNAPAGRSEHHVGPNPHLFASPKMASAIVRNIAAGLAKVDPAGAELYQKNAQAYAANLEKLAADFVSALKDVPNRKIVTEHAVFDYLARDCGLEIVAVVEENPGQEPVAAEMLALTRTIKASGAAAVFTEPQYPAKVGQAIAREVGIPVAVMDPVASGPEDAGREYYEKTMRANLDTLVKVLGRKVK